MIGLGQLLQLASSFTTPSTIQTHEQHCLNARHPGADCSLCMDICPSTALRLDDNKVLLDVDRCIKCGACLWYCPSGVFQQDYAPESRLLATIHQQERRPVEIVCPAAQAHVGYVAEAMQVLAPRCLAALSPAMLINLVNTQGTVWLLDKQCAECPLQNMTQRIGEAVDQANAWLELYNCGGKINLVSEHAFSQPVTGPLIDGSKPTVNRRAFLRGHLREKTIVDTPERCINVKNPVDDSLDYWLPQERVRLLQQEVQWDPAPGSVTDTTALGLTWLDVDNEACTLCGWCTGFCPTAALELVQHEALLSLTFQARRCIDCTVCLAACPTEAISKCDVMPVKAIRQPMVLVEDEGQHCTKCGNTTAVSSGSLCVWCSQQQKTNDDLGTQLFQSIRDLNQ